MLDAPLRESLPLPHVSVLTSYFFSGCPERAARYCFEQKRPVVPTSITAALGDGLPLLDLYFLEHRDMPFYRGISGLSIPSWERLTPVAFAARISDGDIALIVQHLIKALTNSYDGQLVGLRPRFTGMATYFPQITSRDQNDREQACKALSNSMRVGDLIGCRHVEFVAGSCTPVVDANRSLAEARKERQEFLAQSISRVQNTYLKFGDSTPPHLCLELEPGPAAVMSSVDDFICLQDRLRELSPDAPQILLNVDIAHMMLQGITVDDLKKVEGRIGHMHISDHACHSETGGVHGSDLPPGTFHRYEEYEPWLKLAVKLTARSRVFSGVLALELEACGELDVIHSSCRLVRRWLRRAQYSEQTSKPPDLVLRLGSGPMTVEDRPATTVAMGDFREGAVLVVDLGNSTTGFFGPGQATTETDQGQTGRPRDDFSMPRDSATIGSRGPEMAARALEQTIEELCRRVHEGRGSVLSFTGDGVVAFFDATHFGCASSCAAEAAGAAFQAACVLDHSMHDRLGLTLRCALHWGKVLVPSGGRLREQAIGADVVVASRLCARLGSVKEPAIVPSERGALFAVSDGFWKLLRNGFPEPAIEGLPQYRLRGWKLWPEISLKGLAGVLNVRVSDRFERPSVIKRIPKAQT